MRVKKISLFVHDLAANPMGRAYSIAMALKKIGFDIEVLGFLINAREVYKPYRESFNYITVNADSRPGTILRSWNLAGMASGDMIYAFKPLWTSYWPALLASGFGRKKPLLLDIDDNELCVPYDKRGSSLLAGNFIRGWNFVNSVQYNRLLHPLRKLAAFCTVSTTALQRVYAGEIILHGPDAVLFDPERPDCEKYSCRKKFNLPQEGRLFLFAGMPYLHKGLQILVKWLKSSEFASCGLVLCGNPGWAEYLNAKEALGPRCYTVDYIPYSLMPQLLAAVDIVSILQQPCDFSDAQMPVKMLDAMAMGKAIIATAVSDLPVIIGGNCPRGWIIPVSDKEAFIKASLEIMNNPQEVLIRGARARKYFLDNASVSSNASKLRVIMNRMGIELPVKNGE